MEYESPILDGHAPFFLDIHQGQIDRFLGGQIVGKLDLGLDVLALQAPLISGPLGIRVFKFF